MEVRNVAGNTWYMEDWQIIPFYVKDGDQAILIDSGLISQREDILETLNSRGLRPVGILTTHTHTDHSANDGWFREKCGTPVAMSLGEAGLTMSKLALKTYYYSFSEAEILDAPEIAAMMDRPERIILPEEDRIEFCGVEFGIVHTPGHSPDHISIMTPDRVLCLGDALLTNEGIRDVKTPYFASIQTAMDSMELLRSVEADWYIAAHHGIHREIGSWIDEDIRTLNEVADQILGVVGRPMLMDEIVEAACRYFGMLSSRWYKARLYHRNLSAYVEYLAVSGKLERQVSAGMVRYVRA